MRNVKEKYISENRVHSEPRGALASGQRENVSTSLVLGFLLMQRKFSLKFQVRNPFSYGSSFRVSSIWSLNSSRCKQDLSRLQLTVFSKGPTLKFLGSLGLHFSTSSLRRIPFLFQQSYTSDAASFEYKSSLAVMQKQCQY